jgi:aspartyl protease family protein
MADFETGRILGAAFLGLIVIMALMSAGRHGLQRTIQQAAIWALIFVVVIAGFGIWADIQKNNQPTQTAFVDRGQVVVPRDRDGHYYITLDINGQPVDFVIDTGASDIVLTQEDATRVGLDVGNLRFFGRANTANGEVRTAPVRLSEVDISGIRDTNLPAFVNEGEMFRSLLGMSYLQRWDKIEITGGELILSRE